MPTFVRAWLLLAVLLCGASRSFAANPAVFIKVSGDQVVAGATPSAASIAESPVPGGGWAYSAVAPVQGTQWNVVGRPNPSVPSGSGNGTVGTFVLPNINGLSLVDPQGNASVVTLTGAIVIADLESGSSTRAEPSAATGSADASLGPKVLMEKPWRIYRGGNGTQWTFAGLPAGAHYFVYVYGSTTDARGCKFLLDAANVPLGSTVSDLSTSGVTGGNVFTSDGTRVPPSVGAALGEASAASQNTVWGRFHCVVGPDGRLVIRTAKNAQNNQYFNGFQVVPFPVPTFSLNLPPATGATVGSSVSMSVVAAGEGTLSYQWRKNGTAISGNASATTAMLTLPSAQESDAGSYDVVVTNEGGFSVSEATVLSVGTTALAPSINTQPVDQAALVGGAVSFRAVVNGTSPLSYQWQQSSDGVSFSNLSGASLSVLDIGSVATSHAGYYRLVVTNSVGTATSSAARLVVAPVLVTPPATAVVATGSASSLSVVVDVGVGAPEATNYVWRRDGVVVTDGAGIGGATTATLQVSSFSASHAGYYTVTASNSAGSVTSTAAYFGIPSTQSVSFAPGNGATGLAIDQQLRLVFPSAPKLGRSGLFRVHEAASGTVVASIDLASFVTYVPGNANATIPNARIRSVQAGSSTANYYYMPLAVYGNEVWITLSPTERLAYGKSYYVTMDAAVLLDSSNAAYPGITNPTTWRFSTKASGPAAATATGGPTTVTVGQDGQGDFATFQGAFDWVPANNAVPRTVRVLPGLYRDNATLSQSRGFVTIEGTGASRTEAQLIYPFAYFAPPGNIFSAGSLRIEASDVVVRNLTVDNIIYLEYRPTGWTSSGSAAFAGAINTVATTGNRLVFDNVLMKGGQDTYYGISGSAYFKGCEIWGSVDFIYGGALAVFDDCDIVQIRPTGGPVCAPSTAYAQPYGEVFINCRFPRALTANGYPYDVGIGTSTFMRPWRQDGMTAIINCKLDTHLSTKGWGEWSGSEYPCRAREYGSTLIGGGAAPTVAERQAAGAFWLNTIDPDYVNGMATTDPLLTVGAGTANRLAVVVDPADYTLAAMFGHSYFALNGWMPLSAPVIATQPVARTAKVGDSVSFSVVSSSLPVPAYQWYRNDAPLAGATAATLTLSSATESDAGVYTVVLSNVNGRTVSLGARLDLGASDLATSAVDGFGREVTGGGDLTPVVVSTPAALKALVEATAPAVITVSGMLNLRDVGGRVKVMSNKTIQGADASSGLIGNVNISNMENVILRGLTLTNPGTVLGSDGRYTDGGDGVSIENSRRILITHCTVFDCADGMIDTRLGSDLVTISWCEFYYTAAQADHRFTMISDGLLNRDPVTDEVVSAGAPLRITMHHNWWSDRCDQRQPSSTNGWIHLYNNYWSSAGNSYAAVARDMAQFLCEGNVFSGVKNPLNTSDNNALLDNGRIRSLGNVFSNCTGAVHAGGDAVFTPPYSYMLAPTSTGGATDVATLVMTYAGNTAGHASLAPAQRIASISGPAAGSSAVVMPSGALTLTAVHSGYTVASYQWRLGNFQLPGSTASTLALSSMDSSKAGFYTVELRLADGAVVVSSPFEVRLGTPVAPAITTQPASVSVNAGDSATLSVSASGSGDVSYQWREYGTDGVARDIAGATGASLIFDEVTTEETGRYDCVVTSLGLSTVTSPATITMAVATASNPSSRLINMSARAHVRNGLESTIVGFVVKGSGAHGLLVRASGPALRPHGISDPVEDPMLELHNQADHTVVIASNDSWGDLGVAALRAAFLRTGAFDWTEGSAEAALVRDFSAGEYTAVVSGRTNAGIGLVELFEDTTSGPRLVNISARAVMSEGQHVLTSGFVVRGPGLKTLLIRLSGPALQPYLSGYADDPLLRLFNQTDINHPIAVNDDWDAEQQSGDRIHATGEALKAFTWTRGGKDAALLVTLRAGSYTAEGLCKGGSGVGLIEVYEVNN